MKGAMDTVGFVESAFAQSLAPRKRRVASCHRISMISSTVSRRKLGQLALGTSAALLVNWLNPGQPSAASSPSFVKDDSGIQYYDVKPGSGPGPVEGDFVVVDYVRSRHSFDRSNLKASHVKQIF